MSEPGGGAFAGGQDAGGDGGAGFAAGTGAREFGAGDGPYLDSEVDAVEEGPGQACLVAAYRGGGAFAGGVGSAAAAAAGAGVGGELMGRV